MTDTLTPPPASWHTQAAALLDAITGAHAQKKRDTIIALVDARLAGRSEETVWKLPQTCNRVIYHTKWKKDPEFAAALKAVNEMAISYKNSRALAALQQSAESLALASPLAVAAALRLLNSDDEGVKLRAAFGILDRAGVETATKSKQVVTIDMAKLTDEQLEMIANGEVSESDLAKLSGV